MVGFAIGYTGGVHDRAGERRLDATWLAAEIAAGRGRVLPVWQDRNLIAGFPGASPTAAYVNGATAAALLGADPAAIFLGVADGGPVFAVDLSDRVEIEAAFGLGAYAEIRGLSALLPPGDAALLATARGLCHWHRTHRFCGACGSPTESREAGYSRACLNPDCARMHYPRLDPAVIMLVESFDPVRNRPVCLLGHNARFPEGVYSTLAGFVEIGETLEQAVRREVREEVGVSVGDVTYRASQPWPFPSSIMLGFRAQGVFALPTPDGIEVTDARWLTPEDLDAAADWEAEGEPLRLPRKDSIARFLVESWRADHRG
jgi:NAD+ diphosphatase